MTYAPTTNAPARNPNVEAYINPDPNPNPNPNPNPYPALNQKPNHTHESIKLCLRRGINAGAIVAGAYVETDAIFYLRQTTLETYRLFM